MGTLIFKMTFFYWVSHFIGIRIWSDALYQLAKFDRLYELKEILAKYLAQPELVA